MEQNLILMFLLQMNSVKLYWFSVIQNIRFQDLKVPTSFCVDVLFV